MSNIYRIITLLLIISVAACVSGQPNLIAANDEDKDIGLGGTGMAANTGSDQTGSGLGGTGIVGQITGYGSVFVNGIEVEYDNDTAFTINGETAAAQPLEIGDVVEILTIDAKPYTQAQVINLRHEIIGKVDSVEPHTYSFTIDGQSIVQSIDKPAFPEVGTTVAVAGFRIDVQTILSTRVTPALPGQRLVRTVTELPFNNKAQRWLVQTHVQTRTVSVQHKGIAYTFALTNKTDNSIKDSLGIKVLQMQKSATGKLELGHEIEQATMPRGRRTLEPVQKQDGNMLQRGSPGSVTNPASGSGSGSGAAPGSGATHGYKL
jgi:hypothetical protein